MIEINPVECVDGTYTDQRRTRNYDKAILNFKDKVVVKKLDI